MSVNEEEHGAAACLQTPFFDHDDPSEPPPTEYPCAGVATWQQYAQALPQGMMDAQALPQGMVVVNSAGPHGVWDCGQVGMMMIPSGIEAQATGAQMIWPCAQQQQAWQPEQVPQANEYAHHVDESIPQRCLPLPSAKLAAAALAAERAPLTSAERANKSHGFAPMRRSEPRLYVQSQERQEKERAKQAAQAVSRTRQGVEGIAGEARQRAEQAKTDAQWPRLPLESETQVRTPVDSVWSDPPLTGNGVSSNGTTSSKVAVEDQVPTAKAARTIPAESTAVAALPSKATAGHMIPAVSTAIAAVPSKIATRDIAVQCNLLTAALEVPVAQPSLCKQCEASLEGTSTTKLAHSASKPIEITAVPDESTAWGPASDWAWDHDEKIDDTDVWNESTSSVANEGARQLPPAPTTPPPLPPHKPSIHESGESSSTTSGPAESESSPSEQGSSPRTTETSPDSSCRSGEDCSKTTLSRPAVLAQAPSTPLRTKMPAATKQNPVQTKPPQESKQREVKASTSESVGQHKRQPAPVLAVPAATANAKSKRNHQSSQKEGKQMASKVSCRLFKLKLKSIVAGLVATLGLLVAQGGFEFHTFGQPSWQGEPVSEEVSLAEMEYAKATAKQVKNDVVAARQRVMDREWKPRQAQFDNAYRAQRNQRKLHGWWDHEYEEILEQWREQQSMQRSRMAR